MVENGQYPLIEEAEEDALSIILEGTAKVTGEAFFVALVENLSKALNTHSAWITEYIEATRQLRALAFWADGQLRTDFIIDSEGTPCGDVIENDEFVHHPDNIINYYPQDELLKELKASSYMGVPLRDIEQKILGHLAVLDTDPLPREPRTLKIFQIFAARAAAELQRLRAEQNLRKREEKYRRIVETAGEGFILLDRDYQFTDVNDMYCKMTGYRRDEIIGKTPLDFSPEHHRDFLVSHRKDLFSGDFEDFESTIVSKDGRLIPVLAHCKILRDDHEEIIGKMAFLTDMTAQKKSLLLAAEIQKSLLPRDKPRIEGFDIDGRAVSCDEIGGDYFDFFWDGNCGNDRFSIVVGDVMGHGVDAALIMTTARTFLRVHDTQCGDAAQVVSDLNRHLAEEVLDGTGFMTLFFLNIVPATGQLRWIRAGHDPAFIYDAQDNRFQELMGTGMALGVDPGYDFEEFSTNGLKHGQLIVIGTDGIWEGTNSAGEMFGKERFRDILRRKAHLNATGIIDAVYQELDNFTSGLKQKDDVTLVVIKVEGNYGPIEDWHI
ncbi:MAG: SpoIIE family protein phosphatase [Desulfobacteraceae bacterium]|jgi:PAS domain S-box-containing protein|nr:SpoIIE family protein phosphatase [Desulfobacteraceae bacterium]